MKQPAEPIFIISKKDKQPAVKKPTESPSRSNVEVDDVGTPPQLAVPVARQPIEMALAEETNRQSFWKIIETLRWRNVSDGEIDEELVARKLGRLRGDMRGVFLRTYHMFYERLSELMRGYGIDPSDVVVSHVIGLGRTAFETISTSESLILFMAENGECRDLHQLVMRYT